MNVFGGVEEEMAYSEEKRILLEFIKYEYNNIRIFIEEQYKNKEQIKK